MKRGPYATKYALYSSIQNQTSDKTPERKEFLILQMQSERKIKISIVIAFGIIASKKSNRFVLIMGTVLLGLSMLGMMIFFTMPKNMVTAVIFSIGLGFTGDATVSPTSGLVSENFSIDDVATLIGVLFFGYQIGAFLKM